jgi:hypothetical protein
MPKGVGDGDHPLAHTALAIPHSQFQPAHSLFHLLHGPGALGRPRSTNYCRSGNEHWSPPPTQLHNAYAVETVTVYYRWQPLFGLTLPVRMRRKDRPGQCIYCESDSKIYPVPSWMLSPECSQLWLGPPLISAEALSELHDLLTSLPHSCRLR